MASIGLKSSSQALRHLGFRRLQPSSITQSCLLPSYLQFHQIRLASSQAPKDPDHSHTQLNSSTANRRNASLNDNAKNSKPGPASKNSSGLEPNSQFNPLSSSANPQDTIQSTPSNFSTHESPLNSHPYSSDSLERTKLSSQTSSSTLASQMLDLASDLPPPPPPNERTGAKSKLTGKRPLSSADKQRQLLARVFGSLILTLTGIWTWNQGREWDNETEKRMLGGGEDGDRLSRTRARFFDLFDYFNKPAWNPLLPDPLPEPHGRPYTLLVDLDDLLVHSGWDREHGWRTAKRPGVDYFLSYLSQLYEIVIFTTQPAYTAAPVCEKLDPYGYYAPYKLFKESCRTKGVIKPQLIKDLDYLGRDLRKVVFVETDPSLVQLHPTNGFIVPKWNGEPGDHGLVDLIPLLEAIVFNGVNDVRDVAKAYQGRDPVRAYAESEARQKKELVVKWQEERERLKSGWHIDLRALFGLSPPKTDEPPKLLVEKDRARAQKAYLDEQKYWKENEATFKKLMEEDRARQMAEMKGSLLGFLTGQVGPPSPSTQQNSDMSQSVSSKSSSDSKSTKSSNP
ncbi:hypothetical protein O181_021469 [Austropuccinia psidii MF-1]|uniref:Mitochondrial import inner membrane translocase subunit TIM50 n=1 Tax=Austropuccinia psidii MF-1 TaxID=1389203 RepID=A0A9Q3CAV0_9BASI|nr:hypothetical protein [Austropuccinia psidii MF-1]